MIQRKQSDFVNCKDLLIASVHTFAILIAVASWSIRCSLQAGHREGRVRGNMCSSHHEATHRLPRYLLMDATLPLSPLSDRSARVKAVKV